MSKIHLKIIVCLLITVILIPGNTKLHALTPLSTGYDTHTDFNKGTYASTQINGSGTGAKLELSGGGYEKSLTINNSGGALSDYQVLLDEAEVGYWKMDEASGSTVADSSGNGYNGTLTGAPGIVAGQYGNARSTSGNNYVSVANVPGTANPITYSFWAQKTATGNNGVDRIIGYQNSSFDFGLDANNAIGCAGYLAIYTPQFNTWVCTTVSLVQGTWTYVTLVFTGSVWKLYINGSLSWTSAATTINISGTFAIGSTPLDNEAFTGYLDEFRMYNKALSSTEITSLFTNNRSPLLDTVYTRTTEAGNDLRFYDTDDSTSLNYWIENYTAAGQNAKVWVKVPSIGASTTKTIYLHYGDQSLAAQSNGNNTFELFDDFSGNTLDLTKFYPNGASGTTTISESGGSLRVLTGSNGAVWISTLTRLLAANRVVDFDFRLANFGNIQFHMSDNQAHISNAGARYLITEGNNHSLQKVIGGNFTDVTTALSSSLTKHVASLGNLGSGNIYSRYDGVTYSASGIRSDIDYYFTFMSASAGSYGDLYIDTLKIRKLASTEPTFTAIGAETPVVAASGNWQSPTDSNVINLGAYAYWGDGSSGSTAFTAVVPTASAGHDVELWMRTATSAGGLASASYVSLGNVQAPTTVTKTKAQLEALGLVSNQYVQVKATFTQNDLTSAQLDSFTLSYVNDTDPPVVNVSIPSGVAQSKLASVTALDSLSGVAHIYCSNQDKHYTDTDTDPCEVNFTSNGNFWYYACDVAGNCSSHTSTAVNLIDTTTPTSVRITDIGLIDNVPDKANLYYYFTANIPVIKGTTEASSTVTFKTSKDTYTTTADAGGNFNITLNNPALNNGVNILRYYSQDSAGNTSDDRILVLIIGCSSFPESIHDTYCAIGEPAPATGVEVTTLPSTGNPTPDILGDKNAQIIFFQVIDSNNKLVPYAKVTYKDKTYVADANGYVQITLKPEDYGSTKIKVTINDLKEDKTVTLDKNSKLVQIKLAGVGSAGGTNQANTPNAITILSLIFNALLSIALFQSYRKGKLTKGQ